MARTVKVEGLRELQRALAELPKATGKNFLVRVLKKRAEPVAQNWRGKAPVKTGHYRDSIIVGTQLTRRQASEARKAGKDFAEVYVGTADPAGQQQEFGNDRHAAQPSGRPAWEEEQDGVLDGIADDLWAEISKSAARLARKAAKG